MVHSQVLSDLNTDRINGTCLLVKNMLVRLEWWYEVKIFVFVSPWAWLDTQAFCPWEMPGLLLSTGSGTVPQLCGVQLPPTKTVYWRHPNLIGAIKIWCQSKVSISLVIPWMSMMSSQSLGFTCLCYLAQNIVSTSFEVNILLLL